MADMAKETRFPPSPPSPPRGFPGASRGVSSALGPGVGDPGPGVLTFGAPGPGLQASHGISRPGAPGLGPRAWACLSFWTPSNYLPLFFWVNYSIHGPLDPPNGITPPKWSDYNGI